MTARFLVGDVHDRLHDIPDHSVDLILTSPPFLALRSYLPDGHPDKAKEIGSEPTPAAFIDVLLQLTAEWGRVLADYGSVAVELGDTYAGSGGAGGDYNPGGLRDGQAMFDGSAARAGGILAVELGDTYTGAGGYGNPDSPNPAYGNSDRFEERWEGRTAKRFKRKDDGWPLAKSLACIPQLYQVALAYGINPLTGAESPAGRWRVRTLKPWIRSNPPVGALGDKERPATSYVIVACRAADRWFDLDAVRTPAITGDRVMYQSDPHSLRPAVRRGPSDDPNPGTVANNAGGAPPRDWWHHVDAVLDTVKDEMPEARGVHYRRALEDAGILTTLEALDVSPKGYAGAHYAVWPPELVRLLVDEMCPRRVCTVCGQPSRRIVETDSIGPQANTAGRNGRMVADAANSRTTVGWSDCGHQTWRTGHVLDPFAGSGTTLAVAQGMGRTATGIDIDERNAWLAQERVGMFLEIDQGTRAAS